jgi:CheY-like chemotaxis protein
MAPMKRILWADTDQDDLLLFKLALERANITVDLQTVRTAADARALLESASSANGKPTPLPDVVVLDLYSPRGFGLDFLHWIRSNPATAALPVVIFSDDLVCKNDDEARVLGISGFVGKGLSCHHTLLEALRPFL